MSLFAKIEWNNGNRPSRYSLLFSFCFWPASDSVSCADWIKIESEQKMLYLKQGLVTLFQYNFSNNKFRKFTLQPAAKRIPYWKRRELFYTKARSKKKMIFLIVIPYFNDPNKLLLFKNAKKIFLLTLRRPLRQGWRLGVFSGSNGSVFAAKR